MVAFSTHQNTVRRHSPVEVLIKGVHVCRPQTVRITMTTHSRNAFTSTAVKLPPVKHDIGISSNQLKWINILNMSFSQTSELTVCPHSCRCGGCSFQWSRGAVDTQSWTFHQNNWRKVTRNSLFHIWTCLYSQVPIAGPQKHCGVRFISIRQVKNRKKSIVKSQYL